MFDIQRIIGAVLIVCIFLISLQFEKRYGKFLSTNAHYPGARFLAGFVLVLIGGIDPLLGALALMILFLWIADTELVSSLRFG